MKERPILFSTPMVEAILAGKKTQTRRVVKVDAPLFHPFVTEEGALVDESEPIVYCPYGAPGDRLWVREQWNLFDPTTLTEWPRGNGLPKSHPDGWNVCYNADDPVAAVVHPQRPSIHMPRWASRLTLEVISVEVERLQQITDADAWDEGVFADMPGDSTLPYPARDGFSLLWDEIHGVGAWEKNPWVWAVGFELEEDASA